jgi:hypothetical protein
MESIIFSIDAKNIYQMMKFYRTISDAQATKKLMGNVIPCIGKWDNVLELSFIMLAKDFDEHIRNREFFKGQEYIIRISSDTRQPLMLEEIATGILTNIGKMIKVDDKSAFNSEGFTFRMDTNEYFIAQPL